MTALTLTKTVELKLDLSHWTIVFQREPNSSVIVGLRHGDGNMNQYSTISVEEWNLIVEALAQ